VTLVRHRTFTVCAQLVDGYYIKRELRANGYVLLGGVITWAGLRSRTFDFPWYGTVRSAARARPFVRPSAVSQR
jgi:hypothetical protein